MEENEFSPADRVMQLITGTWIGKPIYVAAELGIADILDNGPLGVEELSRLTKTHAPSLYRVLRALASIGIFSECENRRFELTPMGQCLKSGALRPAARMFHADWNDRAWMSLLDAVKSGANPFEMAHGLPLNEWLEHNPRAAELLGAANAFKAAASHRAIVDAYDFSGIDTLTDVGGGYGTLMVEILTAHPRIRGTVADLPNVVEQAGDLIREKGLADRCQTVACDFFKQVPGASDAYLLSHVLHDWSDEQCAVILKNCLRAMKATSKLLIVEMIVPEGNEPSLAKLLDLEMLVITGGRERTEIELRELLEGAGFKLTGIIASGQSINVIEAELN